MPTAEVKALMWSTASSRRASYGEGGGVGRKESILALLPLFMCGDWRWLDSVLKASLAPYDREWIYGGDVIAVDVEQLLDQPRFIVLIPPNPPIGRNCSEFGVANVDFENCGDRS